MKNIDLESITILLSDPRVSEARLVIVSDETGKFRGYISQDGEKLFEYVDDTVEEILKKISFSSRSIIE